MFLLELVLVLVAQIHDRRHVHFVERGQNGVGLLRLEQTLGDTRAQTRHRHALFRAVLQPLISRCRRLHVRQRRLGGLRCGSRCRCSGLGGGCACRQHVALGDAAVAARAGDVARRQALLRHQLAGSRRSSGVRTRCGCGLRGRCGSRSRSRRRFGSRLHFGFDGSGASLAFGVDLGDDLIGRDGVAVVRDDLREHAGRGCRHFEHDLVGLDFDENFVLRHSLAGLLLPLQHGGFRDRLGQLGNLDFNNSHYEYPEYVSGDGAVNDDRLRTLRAALQP
ncbi:hypothetical protein BgramDRAFT_4373 [Paraburkholderia graminis C4D1M]|uniref:Uncharacterized protein n=1 Tax=Paraburkholderia graminis (strain ATCC 700544 / DSM 17151 / LMG 18924 / NCIMB 13744 / C4D1M) TaxID=396598 RepID=B1G4T6_PARG4|nr:hypothetical protein BgramDRAFT_4373 [Paraburkholderia graminis C4D1M]